LVASIEKIAGTGPIESATLKKQ